MALLPFTFAGAAAPFGVEDVMRLLAERPSASVRFVETRESRMLKKPLTLSGRLVYQKPDRLEKHVESPFAESTVIERNAVIVTRPGDIGQPLAVPAGTPARALIEGLRATMAGDRSTLERHFSMTASGTHDRWTLVLTPRDDRLAAAVERVEFRGERGNVLRIEVRERSGDRSLTTIDPPS
ncbi:MAG TPA: LolA-related protein [Casimicrobiaceae bacterium]|nr:LolA-related protein [Casimicrobiaceae bacterium]